MQVRSCVSCPLFVVLSSAGFCFFAFFVSARSRSGEVCGVRAHRCSQQTIGVFLPFPFPDSIFDPHLDSCWALFPSKFSLFSGAAMSRTCSLYHPRSAIAFAFHLISIFHGSFHAFLSLGSLLAEQLKILTAALFSVILMQKHLSLRKWRALALLVLGVIQIVSNVDQGYGSPSSSSSPRFPSSPADTLLFQWSVFFTGVAAVLVMVSLSGFSGVFFERILKRDPDTTIWDRNIQLSMWSIVIGLVYTLFFDSQRDLVWSQGFLHGFSWVTWACVLLSALGGLLTAVVVRYTDNIIKGFAVSISIILTAVFSMFLFGTQLNLAFATGVGGVIISVFTYSEEDPPPQSTPVPPPLTLSVIYPAAPCYVVRSRSPPVSTSVVEQSDEMVSLIPKGPGCEALSEGPGESFDDLVDSLSHIIPHSLSSEGTVPTSPNTPRLSSQESA